ncbi:ProQ/FinO family protein [Caballeronia sp. HLA56]
MGFEQLAALKLELNQRAKDTKAESHTTSTGSVGGREIERGLKPPPTSRHAAERAVTTLQRNFPRAFPRNSAPKVPLKVGVLKDVLAQAGALGLSERDVRNGVKLWCRGQRYWTCLVEGSERVDLNGAVTGVVTEAEAEYALTQERVRLARRREQMENKQRG